jgi:hypothetical protein
MRLDHRDQTGVRSDDHRAGAGDGVHHTTVGRGRRDRPVGAEADDEGGGEPGAAQTPAGLPGGNGRLGAAGGRERDRECHLSHAKSLTC